MKTTKRTAITAALIVLIAAAAGCAMMHHANVERPAEAAFGLGPRVSAKHLYKATLQPEQPLRVRRLQTVRVSLTDAQGHPIEGAAISVDGGMPQHGHGLPTQPQVKRALGGGVYQIEGLRFSMGGWWELKLAIDSPAGRDSVTFNLSL
jgi:hypothetical protein